jgi:hypothetical protein
VNENARVPPIQRSRQSRLRSPMGPLLTSYKYPLSKRMVGIPQD